MPSATLSGASLATAQQQFTAALPAMTEVLQFQLRGWSPKRRAEVIADAQGAAWAAWYGLVRRGKDPLTVGITGIAFNAARFVRAGRQIGRGKPGPATDVMSRRAQREHGFALLDLERIEEDEQGMVADNWHHVLMADRRTTPADAACFNLDFRAWRAGLPRLKRVVAERLAEGFSTGEVAKKVRLSCGRVSQIRALLKENWASFQGEPVTPKRRRGVPRRGTAAGRAARLT